MESEIRNLKSEIWYMECGTHVNSCRSSGCCSFCGLYWFNDWKNDVDSWMKEENIRKYRDLQRRGQNREAHCLAKANFHTYCFQLSGSRYLLQMLLRLDI